MVLGMPSGKLTRLMERTVREVSGVPLLLKKAPVRATARALFDVGVGGVGATEDGEDVAGAVDYGDGDAGGVGRHGGVGDDGGDFGGGELRGVGGGVDGDRGGVAGDDGESRGNCRRRSAGRVNWRLASSSGWWSRRGRRR